MSTTETFAPAIATLKRAQAEIAEHQSRFKVGSPEWHALETADDKLHEALSRLGD